MLDVVHKVASVVMASALVGMFTFYVDIKTEMTELRLEVKRANSNTSLILTELNRLHPRR